MTRADAIATPGLIDIERPPVPGGVRRFVWRLPRLFLIALGAVVLIAVLVLGVTILARRLLLWPGTGPVILCVVVLLAPWLVLTRYRWRNDARGRELLRRMDGGVGIETAIAMEVSADPQDLAWLAAPRLGYALAHRGGAGLTIRVDTHGVPFTPYVQPFEARVLAEGDSSFDELARASDAMVGVPVAASTSRGTKPQQSLAWGLGILVTTLVAMTVISPARNGSWGTFFGYLPAQLAICLSWVPALMLWNLLVARPPQWLVVPGGLILRRVPWRGGAKLYLLDRRTSLLIVVAGDPLLIPQITVADEHEVASRRVTSKELEVLLRAWFSPLEPPGVGTLSDLQ